MVWVKFHEELTLGAKRGIPRAFRFVLMELSLKARPLAGRIELPVGMADVDAVHDLLGGDLEEIKAALARFTSGKEPVLFFEDEGECRYLVIPTWAKWNSVGEPPGASTERSRRSRANQRATDAATHGNANATIVAGEAQRSRNAHATPPRVEEIREEKNREDLPSECVSQVTRAPVSQEQPQSTHTQPEESCDMPTLPNADWLADELRRYPAVAPFAADENLMMDLAGGLQAKPHTIAQAKLIVADFVTKSGVEARQMDSAEFQRRFGGYVTSARLRNHSPIAATEAQSAEIREALAIFAERWKASNRATRVEDADDPEHAATCIEQSRKAIVDGNSEARPREVFRRAVDTYLADSAPWLVDAQWPLRSLAKKFSSYASLPPPICRPGTAKAPEEPLMRTTRRGTIAGGPRGNIGGTVALLAVGDKT